MSSDELLFARGEFELYKKERGLGSKIGPNFMILSTIASRYAWSGLLCEWM